jgi:putative tricarboxylic transport membrane protein
VFSADRVTAALLLAVSVVFSAAALKYYEWWGPGGPGSAFLPFWLGLVMAGLALMLLLRKSLPSGIEWPKRTMLTVLAVTIAFVALLKVLGMVIGTALYLAILVRYLGRHRWWVVAGVALATAGLNWLVFVRWLHVPFPEGVLWIF